MTNSKIFILTTIVYLFQSIFFPINSYPSIPHSKGPQTKQEAIKMFEQGIYHQKQGKIQKAILFYSQSIALEASPGAYNNRGMLYTEIGEYKKAISDYSRAIALAPSIASTYANRGEIWTVFGRYDDALSDYNKAIELDPNNDVAYNNRGFHYWQITKNFEAALADFDKAIEINPYLSQSYLNRSAVYKLLNYDKKIIVEDLTKAISLNPLYSKAYLKRGSAYAEDGKVDDAINDFSKVIEIEDKDSIIALFSLYLRAKLYAQSGLIENALIDINVYLEQIVSLSEKSMLNISVAISPGQLSGLTYEGYLLRGKFYLKLKKLKEAKSDFETAIKISPDSKKARSLKAKTDELINSHKMAQPD